MGTNEFRANDVVLIMGLIAVFGPAFIHLSSPSSIVVSMMWQISFEQTIIPQFNPLRMILILPFTFMRFIVPISFFRLYQNKTTIRRALKILVASEIQPILLYDIPLFIVAINQGLFPFYIPFIIPIPLLALSAILILRFYPPPRNDVDWIEESKQVWWNDSNQTPNTSS